MLTTRRGLTYITPIDGEDTLRGQKTSLGRKKIDVVLLSARYQRDGNRIAVARGIERRGAVWSDLKLFDRQQLLNLLHAGRHVAVGRPAQLEGDVELVEEVIALDVEGAGPMLRLDGGRPQFSEARDLLDLPRF